MDTVVKKPSKHTMKVPRIIKRIISDDWCRAGGECICKCGAEYNRHKNVEGYDWLTILCDGSLVKL